jgi:DNA mismatch endonuclease (patch repair protein)
MTDVVDAGTRSRMMAGIRSTDTKPERLVRSLLHRRGLRFAKTSAGLAGRPDIVLPRWRVVVFVNGCFWHMHDCRLFRMPTTNQEFWEKKLCSNRERDRNNANSLIADRWNILTIWECAMRGADALGRLEKNMDRVAKWIRAEKKNNHCVLSGTGLTYSKYDYEGY